MKNWQNSVNASIIENKNQRIEHASIYQVPWCKLQHYASFRRQVELTLQTADVGKRKFNKSECNANKIKKQQLNFDTPEFVMHSCNINLNKGQQSKHNKIIIDIATKVTDFDHEKTMSKLQFKRSILWKDIIVPQDYATLHNAPAKAWKLSHRWDLLWIKTQLIKSSIKLSNLAPKFQSIND